MSESLRIDSVGSRLFKIPSRDPKELVGYWLISAVSLLLPFGSAILIARIGSAEEISVLSLYLAILGFGAPFFALRLDQLILIEGNTESAINEIASIGVVVCVALSVLVFASLVMFEPIKAIVTYEEPVLLAVSISASLMFSGIILIQSSISLARRQVSCNAIGRVLQQIGTLAIQTLLVVVVKSPLGLVVGAMCGLIINTAWLGKNFSMVLRFSDRIRRNLAFLAFDAVSVSLNAFALNATLMFAPTLWTPQESGLIFLAVRVLFFPITAANAFITEPYKQSVSLRIKEGKSFYDIHLRFLIWLALAGGVGVPMICFVLYKYGGLIFGGTWGDLGAVALLLAPLAFSRIIYSPISFALYALQKSKKLLIISALLAFASGIPFVLGYPAKQTILISSVLQSGVYFSAIGYSMAAVAGFSRFTTQDSDRVIRK